MILCLSYLNNIKSIPIIKNNRWIVIYSLYLIGQQHLMKLLFQILLLTIFHITKNSNHFSIVEYEEVKKKKFLISYHKLSLAPPSCCSTSLSGKDFKPPFTSFILSHLVLNNRRFVSNYRFYQMAHFTGNTI